MYRKFSDIKREFMLRQMIPIWLKLDIVSCLISQKPHSTVPDRSFAVGTLGETMDAIGSACVSFVPKLYPVFLGATKDEDEEVRSNAVFALGVLAANGGDTMFAYPFTRSCFKLIAWLIPVDYICITLLLSKKLHFIIDRDLRRMILPWHITRKYPNVLRSLFDLLNKEKDKRVIDNICAATCRMIMANITGVPMDQVWRLRILQ